MDTDGSIRCLFAFIRPHTQGLSESVNRSAGGASSEVFWLIVLFALFVVLGAYFGASESAFSAMNKIRIKSRAEEGDKRAKSAVAIASDFDRALTALLIGNNITHIAAASVATVIATRLFSAYDRDTVTVLCTVVTTLTVFLFSEMIPKSFANDRSETMALFAAPSLRVLMKILSPLVSFFTGISNTVSKFAAKLFRTNAEPSITEEELYDIIDTIEEEGVVDEEKGDMLKSAMDFSDTHVKDVMTMRNDIRAIPVTLENEKILERIQKTRHTRIPVFDKDLDHIVGILQIRNFVRAYLKNPHVRLRSLLTPPFTVSPDAMIDDLLSEMRLHKCSLAVVSDGEGKTLGLVTIEDFLEELVGEIWDEDDVVDHRFVKLGGNSFRIDTCMTCLEACRRMGVPCPVGIEKDAILSILAGHFSDLPEKDDSYVEHGLEISADEIEDGKITYIVARILPPEELAAYEADSDAEEARSASSEHAEKEEEV